MRGYFEESLEWVLDIEATGHLMQHECPDLLWFSRGYASRFVRLSGQINDAGVALRFSQTRLVLRLHGKLEQFAGFGHRRRPELQIGQRQPAHNRPRAAVATQQAAVSLND